MSEMKVPVLDLRPEIDALWPQLNESIQSVMRSTQFINGPEVRAFEAEVAAYLGARHTVAMNSGTDALVVGLRALGVGPGDEVITTPFTFFATAEAISQLGATPVFVDIDPQTFNLDPRLVPERITARTKAIIPVHLFGHAAAMGPLLDLARKRSLAVLEDVAQGFGGTFEGRRLGTLGDAGTFSFFPSKNLGAFGDGGLLATNLEAVAIRAKTLCQHGSKKKYHNEEVGYNSRLDSLQAAILRVKLPRIETANDGRRAAASRYAEMIRELAPEVVTPVEAPYARHVYHQYTVRIPSSKRDSVKERLAARGIETMVYYPIPLHQLPVYKGRYPAFPHAERAASEVLSLPIWPEIDAAIQERVVVELQEAL
jgi:dTDP-4-amino-4,6-dideoxygalactose transaminase